MEGPELANRWLATKTPSAIDQTEWSGRAIGGGSVHGGQRGHSQPWGANEPKEVYQPRWPL